MCVCVWRGLCVRVCIKIQGPKPKLYMYVFELFTHCPLRAYIPQIYARKLGPKANSCFIIHIYWEKRRRPSGDRRMVGGRSMMLNVHSSHTISHIPAALSSNVEMHACVDRNQRETRRIVRKGKERFFFCKIFDSLQTISWEIIQQLWIQIYAWNSYRFGIARIGIDERDGY